MLSRVKLIISEFNKSSGNGDSFWLFTQLGIFSNGIIIDKSEKKVKIIKTYL